MLFGKEVVTHKPVNTSGMNCPLMGKPCASACHKCEFWIDMEVELNGKPVNQWRCAVNWAPFCHVINNARLDGVQRAVEEMRNRFADYARLSARLMAELPRLILSLPSPPPKDGGSLDARTPS